VAHHVSKAHFTHLVEKALDGLPPRFAEFLQEVPVEIRDRPTRRELRSVGLDGDHLLLGLYQGRPLTERSVMDSAAMPDVIYIFQEDIELCCDSEFELIEQVRTTVLHEIGHHFGMSEEDLEELGYG
jgi:predicted Zn-dependent protease with MMP-like domain